MKKIKSKSFNMGIFDGILGLKDKEARFKELKAICTEYETCRNRLKDLAVQLYEKRKNYYVKDIVAVGEKILLIENLPSWCLEDYKEISNQIKDFQLAVEYEDKPNEFAKESDNTGRTAKFMGLGVAAGGATAVWGSTAAMSIATVMGTASTGTAISALSGVAATNAALAWLGGGAVAAGGAGIAGGHLILAMFGPIGGAIAGVSAASGLAMVRSNNRKQAKKAAEQSEAIKHDVDILNRKLISLEMLIKRSSDFYTSRLHPSAEWISEVKPKDYKLWDDDQKHQLERMMNNISNMAQLINERI